MPDYLNSTQLSRVYKKGNRYFCSQVQGKNLCRVQIEPGEAEQLADLDQDELDEFVETILRLERSAGSENYYEVGM